MGNWFFTHFLSDLPESLSFYTALENNTIFDNNFFGFGGGGSFPPPHLRAPLSVMIFFPGLFKRVKKNKENVNLQNHYNQIIPSMLKAIY